MKKEGMRDENEKTLKMRQVVIPLEGSSAGEAPK